MDEYVALLRASDTGLSASDLDEGFMLSVRLLDDDGEGLDGWLQFGPGVDPPFVSVRFRTVPDVLSSFRLRVD